jgi:hypothetical protein
MVTNKYLDNPREAVTDDTTPQWAQKLLAPEWFKPEKYKKMLKA